MVDHKMTDALTEDKVLRRMTDEKAQKLGYPNAKIWLMEHRLGEIAGEWRTTKDDTLVKEYAAQYKALLALGWDSDLLDFEQMLPARLMPKPD